LGARRADGVVVVQRVAVGGEGELGRVAEVDVAVVRHRAGAGDVGAEVHLAGREGVVLVLRKRHVETPQSAYGSFWSSTSFSVTRIQKKARDDTPSIGGRATPGSIVMPSIK